MIAHQTIGPDPQLELIAVMRQGLEIVPTVGVAEEDLSPIVATLRNMMRQSYCNYPRNTSHAVSLSEHQRLSSREKGSVPKIIRY
jgi:hypothetical protein